MQKSFYKIYEGLKLVKESGRDSIWKFIVQNLYKPYFLANKFDYIIGNPPWFTYSDIKNEEYQDTLNDLAITYQIKPEKIANFPHLEIAAIFLSYCSSYFLKETGKIAFVLPRSFFSASHHDNTRSGKAKGFKLTKAWDLEKINPLFRVPSCVLFADKSGGENKIPAKGINGSIISGRLPAHNCNLKTAKFKIKEEEVIWYYNKQGNSTALSATKKKNKTKINPYKSLFKQGATIVPRNFYFVEPQLYTPDDWEDRIVHIKTSESIKTDAKAPWKDLDLKGSLESCFFFRTAISKNILPFALYQPELVLLPILIEQKDALSYIKLHTGTELRSVGYLEASKWFIKAENFWNIYRTEKSRKMTLYDRLNYQRGLTGQNLNIASAKDANATIVKRADLDLKFIVESKTYVYYTNDIAEAYYLTAILNSSITNVAMKDYQSRGLFGARDVHKKILDIYFPKYDDAIDTHQQLSKLGYQAHTKANAYLADNQPKQALTAHYLGQLRLEIKKHLSIELNEIDKLVMTIIN